MVLTRLKKVVQRIKDLLYLMDNPHISREESKRSTLIFLLYLIVILSLFPLTSGVIEQVSYKLNGYIFFYSLFYIPLLGAIIFRHKISSNTITFLIILSAYLLGTYFLISEAFYGASILLYLGIVIITSYFLGFKIGMLSLAICIISMVVAGHSFIDGILIMDYRILNSYKHWVTWASIIILFSIISMLISVSLLLIQRKIISSLNYAEKKTTELNMLNDELTNLKKGLEDIIETRTSELETKNKKLIESNTKLKELNMELERLNALFVGREFRIKELKEKVKELEKASRT